MEQCHNIDRKNEWEIALPLATQFCQDYPHRSASTLSGEETSSSFQVSIPIQSNPPTQHWYEYKYNKFYYIRFINWRVNDLTCRLSNATLPCKFWACMAVRSAGCTGGASAGITDDAEGAPAEVQYTQLPWLAWPAVAVVQLSLPSLAIVCWSVLWICCWCWFCGLWGLWWCLWCDKNLLCLAILFFLASLVAEDPNLTSLSPWPGKYW